MPSGHDARVNTPTRRWLSGWFVSAALVAGITGVLALLEGHTQVSSLVGLYLLAVLPVAVVWGTVHAVVVSIASAAVFDYMFVPPKYGFAPTDSGDWITLAAFVVTALVTGQLASSTTACCASRCATTGSAARAPTAAPAWSGSTTAPPR
jgi:K+-sensing histidine kinase KdpD